MVSVFIFYSSSIFLAQMTHRQSCYSTRGKNTLVAQKETETIGLSLLVGIVLTKISWCSPWSWGGPVYFSNNSLYISPNTKVHLSDLARCIIQTLLLIFFWFIGPTFGSERVKWAKVDPNQYPSTAFILKICKLISIQLQWNIFCTAEQYLYSDGLKYFRSHHRMLQPAK